MKHGSLFSGIGGFDLAATWMGWENVFQCEKDAFCRKVLQYYWPKTECYEDVRQFKGELYKGRIDVLTGGFPCQPFSSAGKRKGTADNRYLWPEMYRIIGEVRPRWVVGENVVGLLNWNRGMAFEKVQVDLEASGYETRPFVLPAAGVGAPHRRDRVWIVAYSKDLFGGQASEKWQKYQSEGKDLWSIAQSIGKSRIASDTDGVTGFSRGNYKPGYEKTDGHAGKPGSFQGGNAWKNFPTQSPICSGNDGISGRLDRIALSKWRVESLRGAGNAIVPQVALQIFKAIEWMEAL